MCRLESPGARTCSKLGTPPRVASIAHSIIPFLSATQLCTVEIGDNRSVELTRVERCAPRRLLLVIGDCIRILTTKVSQGHRLCMNRNPMYSLLLLTNCNLNSIPHHVGYKTPGDRKPASPSLKPSFEGSLRISSSNLTVLKRKHLSTFKQNCMSVASVILSQYTCITKRRRQTDRQYIMTMEELHKDKLYSPQMVVTTKYTMKKT